jgi:hypothetical protein
VLLLLSLLLSHCCYHSVGTGEPGDSGGTPVTFTLVRCLIESSAQEILAPSNTGAEVIAPATTPSENTTTQGIIPGLLP